MKSIWRNALVALFLIAPAAHSTEYASGDLKVEAHMDLGVEAHMDLGSPSNSEVLLNTVDYSNVTNFLGAGFQNGGAALQGANTITRLVADDITPSGAGAGQDVTQLKFSVANFAATTITARARLSFWFDGGGVPGNYYTVPAAVGFTFNPLTFSPGVTVVSGTIGPGLLTMPGSVFWVGITFDDNNGTTGSAALMNSIGQGIFSPPTIGSSGDVAWRSTAAGTFVGTNNPSGSTINFGGTPPANFGWEFTAVSATSTLSVVLGAGGHLTITDTTHPVDVLLRLDASGQLLQIDDLTNGAGTDWTFLLSSVVDIAISTGASNDKVVFDDHNGSIGTLRPLNVNVGDGNNVVIGSTGTLTAAQVDGINGIISDLRTVLAGADNLRNEADALRETTARRAIDLEDLRQSAQSLIAEADGLISQAKVDSAAVDTDLMPYEAQLESQRDAIQNLALSLQTRVAQFTDTLSGVTAEFIHARQADTTAVDSTSADSLADRNRAAAIDNYVTSANSIASDAESSLLPYETTLNTLGTDLEAAGDNFLSRLNTLESESDALRSRIDADLGAGGDAFLVKADAMEAQGTAIEADANALVTQMYVYIGSMLNDPSPAAAMRSSSVQASCPPLPFTTISGAGIIIGTPLNDHLIGSSGIDFMFGGKGNDLMEGNGGFDFMLGGGGDDDLRGGDGYDILLGWSGDDCLDGGALSDILIGGSGDDLIEGYKNPPASSCNVVNITIGLVTVTFSFGDFFWGGDGNDIMNGSKCIDVMFGRAGTDQITGDDGMDFIFGGTGLDVVTTGAGGGFKINGTDISPPLGNLVLGGDDNDDLTGGVDMDFIWGNAGSDIINGGGGYLDLLVGGDGNDVMHGNSGIDFMFGNAGADVMNGDDDPDLMVGGDGPDIMSGDGSVDFMFGRADADVMNGGTGLDLMFGGDGADLMHGNDGVDLMWGGADADVMNGDASLDLMVGGSGADTMHGDDFIDVMFGNDDPDVMEGNNGIDFMFGNGANDTMDGNAGIDLMSGGPGDDTMNGGTETDLMGGGAGYDTMHGNPGVDIMLGGSQNDIMYGDDNLDVMLGNDGNDKMYGGDGIDVMLGNNGYDMMYGENDFDIVLGNAQNDVIDGGSATDLLLGNADNDVIYGGTGVDLVFGGTGNDCIDGGDNLDLLFGNDGDDRVFGASGNDLVFGQDGNDCIDGGDNADFLFGIDGDDVMNGGNGGDWMWGGQGADIMNGDSGNDWMFGGPADDRMYGGPGRDKMWGNGGNDYMRGGSGWDWCFGGPGNDDIDGDGPESSGDVCPVCQVATGVLQGSKFWDINHNSNWDAGEPGLYGWTITYSGPQSGTVSTASGGGYSITGLAPGVYTVCEVVQANWTQSYPPGGCYTVKIGTGETVTGLNSGNYKTASSDSLVDVDGITPSQFALRAAYPNPASVSARIAFDLPRSAVVTLKVFDMTGRLVTTLADRGTFPAGTHNLVLNGRGLRSGVYLSRMVVEAADGSGVVYKDSKRLILVR